MADAPHWTDIDWGSALRELRIDNRLVRFVDYGEGAPVVCVHGLGGSWTSWLPNIPELGTRHRVIALDLPGFGRSEPLPAPSEMRQHAEVIAALIEAVDEQRVAVIAHSMGGLVAMELAISHPELVNALVQVNAGGVPLSPRRLAILLRIFTAWYVIARRPGVLDAVARRPRLRRAHLWGVVADPATIDGRLAIEQIPLAASSGFLDAVAAGGRAAAALDPSAVRCPVLLVWGALDRILPLATAQALVEALPDAELEVIADAAHSPMIEQPARFNDVVLRFLARRAH